MSYKKILAVVGATGAQGGGLCRAILEEGTFACRALTRDTGSEAAQALAGAGAEVVAADVDDQASLDRAFEDAYGAFCVTFFWNHFDPGTELAQAQKMASAAKKADLKHVIWSSLEDTREKVPLASDQMPTLMGNYKVPHFDAKGEADQIFRNAGLPLTILLTSFYWDNLIAFGMGPQKQADGSFAFNLPMGNAKLPGIAAEDIGRCAYGIFKRPDLVGQKVGIAGEHLSGVEMASALSRALGESVSYNAVPFDVYRGLGFPGADDLGNMFQFKHDFEEDFRAPRSVEFSRELNPRLQSFEDWLKLNGSRISVA